ncbi:hypothetical protein FKM82_024797 [Ascaphus truei]
MCSALCKLMMPSVKSVSHTYASLNINAPIPGPATITYDSRIPSTSVPIPLVDYPLVDYPLVDYDNMQIQYETPEV